MKNLILFITLLFTSTCYAEQLHNYDQIKSAVDEGKLIRIFVNYTKCTPASLAQKMVGNHDAVYTPNAIAITNEGDIVSYILYFTMNDGRYPSKAIYQYGKYSISNNNTLVLTFTSLNAIDYSPLGNSESLTCKIDDGVKIFCSRSAPV